MLTACVCIVETADCETDGYLSSSGLQDPLEAGSFNATPPTTQTDNHSANGLPIPALRFPSVSGLSEEPVINVGSVAGAIAGSMTLKALRDLHHHYLV